jgi:hypothetical protein
MAINPTVYSAIREPIAPPAPATFGAMAERMATATPYPLAFGQMLDFDGAARED